MQTYVSLKDFKGAGIANLTGDAYDSRLLPHLEAVSRQIEAYLGGRWFYPRIETRYFPGDGGNVQKFPGLDIISISALLEDTTGDATYDTTWASSDYILAPYENDPTNLSYPKPYGKLEVDQRSTGSKTSFGKGQQRFKMTGKFGFCELTEATGATINEGAQFSSSDTTLTVDVGSYISVGDTLVIESEYLYVSGQEVGSGNDFTVVRGMHGSTAAAHDDGTAISRLVYPRNLVQACIEHASRHWGRGPTNYMEDARLSDERGFTLDVRQLLDPFKRFVVA